MKRLKVLQEQPKISCSSVWNNKIGWVYKQEDWLGSVRQVFVNKKITFTYLVDETLKVPDQSCSRIAKNQLFSLSHTLLSEQVTDSVCNSSILCSVYLTCLRTVFKNRSQEFSDWQASHEEFKTVQRTALKQFWETSSIWSNKWLTLFKEQAWEQFLKIRLRTSEQAWDQLSKVFAPAVLRSVEQGVCSISLKISCTRCLQQQSWDQLSKVVAAAVSWSVV